MAIIQFDNGVKVNFDGTPTPADVEEVAQKLGIGKPKSQGILGAIKNVVSGQAYKDLNIGAGKGVLSTLQGLGQIGQRLAYGVMGKKNADILRQAQGGNVASLPTDWTTAKGNIQRIGKGAEQTAEFFVPGGVATKAVKVADVGINALKAGNVTANILKLATRAGIGAAEGAGITAAQTGANDPSQIKAAAMISGAIPIAGALIGAFARGGSKLATELETKLLKPGEKDLREGFNVNTIKKYNLGGSLEQTATKLDSKLADLGKQLRSATSTKGVKVNVADAIDAVEKELAKAKASTFGSNAGVQRAIDTMRNELAVISKSGTVSLQKAQQIKQAIGKLGAWQYRSPDPDASAMEAVANSLYRRLKLAIEKASPADIKAINKQFSELLPVERVLIRRIPVAARQTALSLGDLVGGVATLVNHPMGAAMWIVDKGLKSGQAISGLQKASDAIMGASNSPLGNFILGPNNALKKEIQTGGTRLQKTIRSLGK